ncbi:MAG: hypothetical protein Q9205_006874 [Flavoplaca limonia]
MRHSEVPLNSARIRNLETENIESLEKNDSVLDQQASLNISGYWRPTTLNRQCAAIPTNLWLNCANLYKRHIVREAFIPPGKTRIRWTCRCGKSLYDDFEELRPGAARDLEIALNQPSQQNPGGERPNRRQHDTAQPLDEASSGNVIVSSGQATSTGRSKPSPAQESRPNQSIINISGTPHDPENKWLLVCASERKRPIRLSHLDVFSMSSDYQLLTELRRSYTELKRAWYHRLSMRNVKTIKYIRFELHPYDLVDVRKTPDMPPAAREDEYQFQPCDLLPPIGENLLTHHFENPHESNTKAIVLLRSPKKRKERLAICPQKGTNIGWGLHLVEGWLLPEANQANQSEALEKLSARDYSSFPL